MPKDVRGTWKLKQSNNPLVTLTINEQDGDGTFAGGTNKAQFGNHSGPIEDARTTETEITFRVRWSNGPVGRYTGRFDFQGRLTGFTFDESNPAAQATWVAIDKLFGNM